MGLIHTARSKSNSYSGIYGYMFVKRFCDIVVSFALLVILSPLLLIIGFIIWKREGEPILYKELRIGKDKKPFTMYMFRTTTVPSKVIRAFPPHPVPKEWEQGVPNAFHFIRHQNVQTPTGLFLKKYRLDKLPQLVNVLKGDMSLVGPSPEIKEIADYYNYDQMTRLQIRPGLTGYAQLKGKTNRQFSMKMTYDIYYVQHCSLRLDCKILLQTMRNLVRRNVK